MHSVKPDRVNGVCFAKVVTEEVDTPSVVAQSPLINMSQVPDWVLADEEEKKQADTEKSDKKQRELAYIS